MSTLKIETLSNSSQNPRRPHQDRISPLPDHILHHILSFLPTKYAVQTSILSKRWCDLWKFVSAIGFDISYSKNTGDYFTSEKTDFSSIDRCLFHHKAKNIIKFDVVVDKKECPRQNVRQWVSFALLKQVKVLKFRSQERMSFDRKLFAMPDMLYKKDRVHLLEIMYLSSVDFCPRSGLGFSGFSFLKELSFKYCKVSDETLGVLLSKCLVLEALSIVSCQGLENVNISGPNLRLQDLVFHSVDLGVFFPGAEQRVVLKVANVPSLQRLEYVGEVTKIHLNRLPNLSQVTIIGMDKDETSNANIGHLRALVSEVAKTSSLGVNSWFLELMAEEHQTGESSCIAFQNLKDFIWHGKMQSECEAFNLTAFLGTCPCLEGGQFFFRDGVYDYFMAFGHNAKFTKMEGVQDNAILEQLRFIKLWGFSGSEGEMELVKRLLEMAVALETMQVFWRVLPQFRSEDDGVVNQMDLEIEMELQRKLIRERVSRFPKASSHCQIVF